MGYMRHHAIFVTGENMPETGYPGKWLKAAHEKAKELFPVVSEILPGLVNTEDSFFIPPDGSKEGWPESDEGDRRRDQMIRYLRDSWCSWIEIQYGDDNGDNGILRQQRVRVDPETRVVTRRIRSAFVVSNDSSQPEVNEEEKCSHGLVVCPIHPTTEENEP